MGAGFFAVAGGVVGGVVGGVAGGCAGVSAGGFAGGAGVCAKASIVIATATRHGNSTRMDMIRL
jgi:hypothetical protein